ncbi:hypothetical protein CFE70_009329 [Pyrenophora teres f. teres 0-1]|nr:hypothetical protein P3342_012067 [Pyrenophora teres f. teres]
MSACFLFDNVAPSKEQLCQFSDKLLIEAHYNVGSDKAHIMKYNHDFFAKDVFNAVYRFQNQRD